jgi:chaperone LolA
MKRFSSAVLSLLILLGFAQSAHAASAEAELQRFIDGVLSFEAAFSQVQTDESGELISNQSGHFWLSRPGRFRWSYEKPYEQQMICDGQKIWLYDPDLRQVTVRPAGEALAGTPAELLTQKAQLSSSYTLEDRGTDKGARLIKLVPKSQDSDFRSIELWLVEGAPQRLRFLDQLGGKTDVQFRDTRVNAVIDNSRFSFVPPRGVEVIEGAAGR